MPDFCQCMIDICWTHGIERVIYVLFLGLVPDKDKVFPLCDGEEFLDEWRHSQSLYTFSLGYHLGARNKYKREIRKC